MADKTHSEPGTPGVLSRLAGIAVVAVALAGIYVGYQALQVLFPPNTYETAMLATVADTVSADGVLLFDETYISGSGTLGYLAADGERVSAGAAVAEIYSSPEQAGAPPAAHGPERPDRAAPAVSEHHRHPAGLSEERAFRCTL